jgi:hypothetical protein
MRFVQALENPELLGCRATKSDIDRVGRGQPTRVNASHCPQATANPALSGRLKNSRAASTCSRVSGLEVTLCRRRAADRVDQRLPGPP